MYIFNQLVELVPTNHAELRMAQRNVSEFELEFVLDHGHRYYHDGWVHYVLRGCDIPECLWHEFCRLEGTTVIFCPQSRKIITVYRDHQWRGGRRVKRKPAPKRSRKLERYYH